MKLAVIFPGIGYHTDKPLLYYSKRLAKQYGYDIVEVTYGGFPKDVKGSPEKMKEAIQIIDKKAEIEISGNVTRESIQRLTGLGVAYISSGALTHSAPIMDISMKHLHQI